MEVLLPGFDLFHHLPEICELEAHTFRFYQAHYKHGKIVVNIFLITTTTTI